MSLLMDRLMEKYQSAISHVKFLLEIELDGTPATLNHCFNENLETSERKSDRTRKADQLMGC